MMTNVGEQAPAFPAPAGEEGPDSEGDRSS